MKSIYTLILSSFLLNACAMNNMNPQRLDISVTSIENLDPVTEAHAALAQKNNTLIGFDQRGLKVPGVKQEDLAAIQKLCPVQRLDGMGDVVKSAKHLKQMQKVYQYSLKYNQVILNSAACE